MEAATVRTVNRLAQLGAGPVVAVLAFLTLVPVVLMALLSISLASQAVERSLRSELRSAAAANAAYVGREMLGVAELVESYARRPLLRSTVEQPGVGQETVVATMLRELKSTRPQIATAFFVEPSGRLVDIVPETPTIVGVDFSFRDWYRGVSRNQGPYVSEAYESAASTRPRVVGVAAPVKSIDESRVIGYMVAGYSLDGIRQFARDFGRAQGVGLSVRDQAGQELTERSGDTAKMLRASAPVDSLGWTVATAIPASRVDDTVAPLRSAVLGISLLLAALIVLALVLLYLTIRARVRTEAELRVVSAQAFEASRLKSEFLANMSHEIRTPLNGIIGMIDLLIQTPLTSEQQEYAATVRSSGDLLLAVINDILDFSKIEAGKLDLDFVDFDLHAAVEGAATLVSERAHAKGLEMVVAIDSEVPARVHGDPLRLRQVMVNLLSNAVKFTDDGEVVLGVRPVGTNIHFEVRDTGIGIAAGDVECIWESFSQADGSTTRRFGGTGLGLAISRQLVALLGGEIGVTSELGLGSIFWFSIPLPTVTAAEATVAEATGTPAPIAAVGRPSASAKTRPSRQASVLVVDDNAVNQRVATLMLEGMGHRAEVASNGREAVDAVVANSYDVVLMDCQMPEMDGFEATAAIRVDERVGRIPIIAMTAGAMTGDEQKCLAAGMNDYISKPFRHGQLQEVVERWLGPTEDRATAPPRLSDTDPAPTPTTDPGEALSTAPVLDADQLASLRELEEDSGQSVVAHLITTYLDDATTQIESLRAAVGEGDAAETGRLAHGLKGSSATVGAASVAQACAALERAAIDGVAVTELPARMADVEAEFRRSRPALDAERDRPAF